MVRYPQVTTSTDIPKLMPSLTQHVITEPHICQALDWALNIGKPETIPEIHRMPPNSIGDSFLEKNSFMPRSYPCKAGTKKGRNTL